MLIQISIPDHLMKKAIIVGSVLPIIVYLIFASVVVGMVGLANFEAFSPNERIATIALGVYSNPILGVLANILAVFAMFTSFLTIGIALTEMYHYDFKLPRWLALLLTLSIPLIIFLAKLTSFIVVIGLAGVLAGGVDGILIVLAYWKAKKMGNRKPEYSLKTHKIIGWVLITMFALGIIYQIWQNFF